MQAKKLLKKIKLRIIRARNFKSNTLNYQKTKDTRKSLVKVIIVN